MSATMTQLMNLLDEAFVILHVDDLGVNHAEPVFTKILEILRTDADARHWFIQRSAQKIISGGNIVSSLDRRPTDFIDADLICFVSHASRWEEFRVACEERRLSRDYLRKMPGSRDIADYVLASLSDDWEDKEFYQTFSGMAGK